MRSNLVLRPQIVHPAIHDLHWDRNTIENSRIGGSNMRLDCNQMSGRKWANFVVPL